MKAFERNIAVLLLLAGLPVATVQAAPESGESSWNPEWQLAQATVVPCIPGSMSMDTGAGNPCPAGYVPAGTSGGLSTFSPPSGTAATGTLGNTAPGLGPIPGVAPSGATGGSNVIIPGISPLPANGGLPTINRFSGDSGMPGVTTTTTTTTTTTPNTVVGPITPQSPAGAGGALGGGAISPFDDSGLFDIPSSPVLGNPTGIGQPGSLPP